MEIGYRLRWCQDSASDTGAILIDAVVFAIAEIALDIALRGYGQMYPSELRFCIFIETGVFGSVQCHHTASFSL
jgi:hypothetical protein